MKHLIFSIIILFIVGCNDVIKKNNVEDKNENKRVFSLIRDNLYQDNKGKLYFKSDVGEERFITVVYSESYGIDGIKEITQVVDKFTFNKISETCFKDKNNYYFFKRMQDGGTLEIVSNCGE